MPGDYSRTRYTPRSGYIASLEQQGRVRLDADGNEFAEAVDRRRRAETIDTIGHGTVPLPTPTQNAFQIQFAGGQYTIGQGRAYVDGILVDCWGDESQGDNFEADLGESLGSQPLAYTNQPFYYTPNFPTPAAAGPSILYLDVWEREVTALDVWEQPGTQAEYRSLIDPALEGIDTTTRIQVAWQVKALNLQNPVVCSDNPQDWTSLTASSTGVMSSGTAAAPSTASACVIDPTGGYTGLENRLYRVQIQSSGTVGQTNVVNPPPPVATFVWSKENASFGANLVSITNGNGAQCQLTVTTVGRDKTFGFQVGDVLEVLDDFVEWSIRENNHGGQFVTVTAIDPENLALTVNPDISGFTVVAARHPRLRRWDALPQPTNNGNAIALGIEGVTVTFGASNAATLSAGDYWTFCARTATGTVEILNQALPRGVLHHYMRLAVTNPPNAPQDCRVFWPPSFGGEGCCTVVVNVGDDIQKAINSLDRQIGGCVCLKAGAHSISTALSIEERKNVYLHGESIGATVQNMAGGTALQITNQASNITIEHITFVVTPQEKENGQVAIIQIAEGANVAVRHCHLAPMSLNQSPMPGFGFTILGSDYVEIRDNVVEGCLTGLHALQAKRVGDLVVAENFFSGPTLMQENVLASAGVTGIELQTGIGFVHVSDNVLTDFAQGVLAPFGPDEVSVTGNIVNRRALVPSPPIFNPNWTSSLGSLIQQKAYGVVVGASGARVAYNQITMADPGHGGILAFGSGIVLKANSLPSSIPMIQPPPALELQAVPGGGALLGTYDIAVAFTSNNEESSIGPASTVTVGLSVIVNLPGQIFCLLPQPTDPNVTGWRIYGFKHGVSTSFQLIANGPTSQPVFVIAQDQNSWGPSPSPNYAWSSLPIGIVGYKPSGVTAVSDIRISNNMFRGPQKGIAVLAEIADTVLTPIIEGNRFVSSLSPESIDVTQPENTIPALQTSLQNLDNAFGVLTINADRAAIIRNFVSGYTLGIAAITLEVGPMLKRSAAVSATRPTGTSLFTTWPNANLDCNDIDSSTIGILMAGLASSMVQQSKLDSNQLGICLYSTGSTTASENQCIGTNCVVQLLDVQSTDVHFKNNHVSDGQTGVLAYQSTDIFIEGNTVSFTKGTGILTALCEEEILVAGNDVTNCGVTGQSSIEQHLVSSIKLSGLTLNFGTAVAAGIAATDCTGMVTVHNCTVRKTSQPSGATCIDICVVGQTGNAATEVRDCRITRSAPSAQSSRGILVLPVIDFFKPTLMSIQVSGNHVDIVAPSSAGPLNAFSAVDLGLTPVFITLASCDLLFNDNLVIQEGAMINEGFAVNLKADVIVATGNRIRSIMPSLTIVYGQGLTYVGNIVSHAANIVDVRFIGNELPLPAASFNVNA